MKICFSTLACPEWSWPMIISGASDLGFDGIELRGVAGNVYLPKNPHFDTAEHIAKTMADIERLQLEVPILTTGATLGRPDRFDRSVEEIKAYLELASIMNVPYLRVMGDDHPEITPTDEALVEQGLRDLLPLAEQKGRMLLLETNGVYAESDKLLALVEKLNSPALGVLWDVHHPYRFFDEPVAETYAKLKKHIKHVHLKDSVLEGGKLTYKMFGCGDLPIREALALLYNDNYAGYISLEWVRRWNPSLEAPGIALPHYISVAQMMLRKIKAAR